MLLKLPGVAAFALADPLKAGCQALFGLTDEETWQDDHKETSIGLWAKSPREFFQTVGTEWMRYHNADHWLMRADREINPPEHPSTSSALADLTSPDAPFQLAAKAFFDFSDDQIWNPASSAICDAYWGLSPADAVALLKRYAYDLYPDFDKIRRQRPVRQLARRGQVPADAQTIIIKDIRFENEAAFLRSHNGEIWHISRQNLQKVNAHSSELGVAQAIGDLSLINNGTLEDLQALVAEAWNAHTQRTPNNNEGSN
ncbi:deoxynucleotide monophosphate kinase [Pseudomonas psychrophila]|nr:deoxynucleotide monophosphate kinase [Pseudomonas psychrophila]KMN03316.1 deoxynucleotide monophosphate kinase [Pseudomonas psychrophila]QIE35230.1 deoxynucleotide monophosphate kinase [Pseudomonas psychrophila]